MNQNITTGAGEIHAAQTAPNGNENAAPAVIPGVDALAAWEARYALAVKTAKAANAAFEAAEKKRSNACSAYANRGSLGRVATQAAYDAMNTAIANENELREIAQTANVAVCELEDEKPLPPSNPPEIPVGFAPETSPGGGETDNFPEHVVMSEGKNTGAEGKLHSCDCAAAPVPNLNQAPEREEQVFKFRISRKNLIDLHKHWHNARELANELGWKLSQAKKAAHALSLTEPDGATCSDKLIDLRLAEILVKGEIRRNEKKILFLRFDLESKVRLAFPFLDSEAATMICDKPMGYYFERAIDRAAKAISPGDDGEKKKFPEYVVMSEEKNTGAEGKSNLDDLTTSAVPVPAGAGTADKDVPLLKNPSWQARYDAALEKRKLAADAVFHALDDAANAAKEWTIAYGTGKHPNLEALQAATEKTEITARNVEEAQKKRHLAELEIQGLNKEAEISPASEKTVTKNRECGCSWGKEISVDSPKKTASVANSARETYNSALELVVLCKEQQVPNIVNLKASLVLQIATTCALHAEGVEAMQDDMIRALHFAASWMRSHGARDSEMKVLEVAQEKQERNDGDVLKWENNKNFIKGFLSTDLETPLFYIQRWGKQFQIVGSFIPTKEERGLVYDTVEDAKKKSESYIKDWVRKHGSFIRNNSEF